MAEPFGGLRRFLRELKRRNVYRVAVAYAVVAFVVVQAADLIFPALNIPPWAYSLVVILTLLGFPIALVLAWAFEMTAEGVRRTPEVESAEGRPAAEGTGPEEAPTQPARSRSRLALQALVGLGLLGAAMAGGWYLIGGGGAPEPAPRAGERSIAVLPFDALSPTEDSRAFARGIHDDLLTLLSNISGLKVISRTSVEHYRDTDLPLPAIAESLGVRWVMEGGVQHMGREIQVNAQLVDPSTDTHVWAETYRRELTTESLFELQSGITKRIAGSLETELTPEEQERVERQPTEDLGAYRLYLQGRDLLDRRTEAEIRSAEDYFARAVARDSGYALAWSGLALSRALFLFYNYAPADSVSEPALRAARRAVSLAPDLGEARASLGIVHSLRREGPAAHRELTRAVELKPSYPEAQIWLSWIHLVLGEPERAVEPAVRAVELDPHGPAYRVYLAEAYLANGRHADALREARRAVEMGPDYGMAHHMEGLALHHAGRHSEAEASWEEVRSLVSPRGIPSHAETWAATAAARAAVGDTAGARAVLSRVDAEADPFAAGLTRAAVGDLDRAFADFRRARVWDSLWTEHIRYFFPIALGPLRDDPRYEDLTRRLNRAWGLDPDGGLPE